MNSLTSNLDNSNYSELDKSYLNLKKLNDDSILLKEKDEKVNTLAKQVVEKFSPENITFHKCSPTKVIDKMSSYIWETARLNLDLEQKKQIKTAQKVLKYMTEQFSQPSWIRPEFIEIRCDDQTAGLMSIKQEGPRLDICGLLTAPWNIVPPKQLTRRSFDYLIPRFGIGSLLLNEAIRLAKTKQAKRINLISLSKHSTNFYLKHHFDKSSERVKKVGMALDLSNRDDSDKSGLTRETANTAISSEEQKGQD